MKCYDCAVQSKSQDAVGICRLCGRAACLQHAVLRRVPRLRRTGAGIGGPFLRLPQDRTCLVCRDCSAIVEADEAEELCA